MPSSIVCDDCLHVVKYKPTDPDAGSDYALDGELEDECPFPVLIQPRTVHERRLMTDWPRRVPWRVVADHEDQAQRNHGQSLVTLASRGGLDPQEMWCVVHDKVWRERADAATCLAWLRSVA